MIINPALLKPPSSLLNRDSGSTASLTPSEWQTIRSSARAIFSPSPAGGRRVRFWLIASLMFLMALCNLITLVKTLMAQKWWMVRFDKAGYLEPNDRLVIPICTFANASLVLCSIILLEQDYNKYLRLCTMLSALLSYNFLFFCAVTKVWKILSVLPIVPVQLGPGNESLVATGLSPCLFNMMIALVYISFAATTLPFGISVSRDAASLGRQVFDLAPQLDFLVDNYLGTSQTLPQGLVTQVMSRLSSLQHLLHRLMWHWRVMSGVYLLFTLSLFAVFIYASVRLNFILKVQLQILSQARRRFSRNISSTSEICASKDAEASNSVQRRPRVCSRLLCDWLSSEPENQSEIYDIRDKLDSCTKHAEFRQRFQMIHSYQKAVGCQLLCISIIFLAFVALEACLTLDVFRMSTRTSVTVMILIKFEWAGWAWSVPGSILSILTCFIKHVPNSNTQEECPTTPMTSFAKPVLELKHCSKPDPAHAPEDADVVNLRSYRVFLPESPPLPVAATIPRRTSQKGRLLRNIKAPLFQCHPLSPESGRARKVSWFSISECEKKTDPRAELAPTDSECEHTCVYHPGSDVDVIKALRARDSQLNMYSIT